MAALPASSQYSSGIAFIYIFNLVIGTGILALPSVLISGGWLLGGIFIVLVAALSYVTVTFMLEAMATTNALIRLEKKDSLPETGSTDRSHLLPNGESNLDKDPYDITEKTELGQMANLYYNRVGLIVFFSVLIIYLFGDVVIYCTVVVRSLLSFIYGQDAPSWGFDLFLCIFFIFIVPFCLFDFQKTKLLQVTTMIIRNVSLLLIIVLAFREALKGEHNIREVPVFDARAVPNLFGGAVYSFMCHHSLPSIITPMKDKSRLLKLTSIAFGLVLIIYMLLFVTCLFAFGMDVLDPITFNFPVKTYGYIGDALVLFPVVTLSSNCPMLLITLRNNLDNLFQLIQKTRVAQRRVREPELRKDRALQRRVVVTLVAVVPPVFCAFVGEHLGLSVDELVGYTGAFAGCVIMFIIPATLVYSSRRVLKDKINSTHGPLKSFPEVNTHASPFGGDKWVYAVLLWAVISMTFNAFEKFSNWYKI
ncbi:unnamed protein product [Calypogeia fissa]